VTTPDDPTMSHRSLDAVIASYVQAVEAGQVPNREALLDGHPEIAEQLHAFFADIDRMDRVASPLRMDGGLDATHGMQADGAATLPSVCYFGDYELLEEIARGGMGVVYKARQASLNRIVALKMILRGTFASPRDVQRFRAEAESAANLDHPHIVPIYEVGEHEGQQYFSMKLVEGASLAKLSRGGARSEIGRFVKVVRAVHYAHQHGVLHRDLKPSNVLVDPRETWFVTDFGLAKRLTGTVADHSLTEPGQVVGTPRYMAPEQAAGRKDLTVAADVYSLGVILYERLTGRTPFLGENVLTVLRQVRETEPPRPSSIRPGLDRDLETVVLKCMDKEPARRYASAEALAEDLSYWLAGRPITARPVGQVERLWRWCKRNPAVAGLTASVAMALIMGAGISTFYAVGERRERIRAERTFAQSLVRPFDPSGDEDNHETLSEAEVASLWELSIHQSGPTGIRFLDEATRGSFTARQLRARSERALIAPIGLDLQQRDRAIKSLTDKLSDANVPLPNKVESALIASELEDRPGAATAQSATVIAQALGAGGSSDLWSGWLQHLTKSSDRIDSGASSRVLVDVLERVTEAGKRSAVAQRLASVSARMEPAEAAPLLSTALIKETDANSRSILASALASTAQRLPPAQRAPILGQLNHVLVAALKRETDANSGVTMATILATAPAALEPTNAAEVAQSITNALAHETDRSKRDRMMQDLTSVSSRMNRIDANRLFSKLSQKLVAAFERIEKDDDKSSLVSVFETIANRLEPAEFRQTGDPVIRFVRTAFEKEKDADARANLAWVLAPLAERTGSEEAAKICRPLAENLTASMQQETDNAAKCAFIRGLAALVIRLSPDQAVRTVRLLAARMESEGDWARVANTHNSSLVDTFYIIFQGLDKSDAGRAARLLASAIAQEKDTKVRSWMGAGLCLIAQRMDPAETGQNCGPVVDSMTTALTTRVRYIDYLVGGFVIVASNLSQFDARRVTGMLLDALKRESDTNVRNKLASALLSVAGRIDPVEAARICGQAATVFINAIVKETNANARLTLVSELALMAARWDAAEGTEISRRAASVLADAMAKETYIARLSTAKAMAALSNGMEADEASQMLVAAIQREAAASSTNKASRPDEEISPIEPFTTLTDGLASVAHRLNVAEAARVCGSSARHLSDMIERETDALARNAFARSLAGIAEWMEPAEASRVCDKAIGALLRARSKQPQDRGSIDQIVAMLLPRLESETAYGRARDLSRLVIDESNRGGESSVTGGIVGMETVSRMGMMGGGMMGRRIVQREYPDSLNIILTDNGREQRTRRAAKTAETAGPGLEGALEAAARISAEPYPCRLTTQELVDLLKMPTCFGAARRIVLDHLGNRYGPRFVNHWAFVRYATEQNLNLDFTSPPRRPTYAPSAVRRLTPTTVPPRWPSTSIPPF
jgi:serine/threonine protein kinase